jgi:hypothetical protein
MSGSGERANGREGRMSDAWRIATSVRLCENKGNRYNKTFAELMDNLRGEAGRGLLIFREVAGLEIIR